MSTQREQPSEKPSMGGVGCGRVAARLSAGSRGLGGGVVFGGRAPLGVQSAPGKHVSAYMGAGAATGGPQGRAEVSSTGGGWSRGAALRTALHVVGRCTSCCNCPNGFVRRAALLCA